MAKKKQKAETKINYAYGRQLFEKLGASTVRSLLDKHFPESTVKPVGTSTFLVNCLTPQHPDAHPSMYINVAQGWVKCKSCGYFTKNLLQLLQDCKGWTAIEAIGHLQPLTNVRILTDKSEKELDEADVHQLATRLVMDACNEHLRNCITHRLSPAASGDYDAARMRAAEPTLRWLFETRKHDLTYVPLLPYGMVPPTHMLLARVEKMLDELTTKAYEKGRDATGWKERRKKVVDRVKFMFENVDGSWTDSVAYFTGYGFTTPGRIKLRMPDIDNVKEKKILALPGPGSTPEAKNADDPLGYFGLYSKTWLTFNTAPRDRDEVLFVVVEGENDAISLMERLLEANKSGVVVLASGGNANKIDELASAGITRVHLWSDEPTPDLGKGDSWIEDRLKTALKVECRVFSRWHAFKQGMPKDPDDVCKIYPFAEVYRVAVAERQISYKSADAWAFDKTVEEVAAKGIPEDELKAREDVAVTYGACVQDPQLRESFVAKICQQLGLHAAALKRRIIEGEHDSEAGFIERLEQMLRTEFHVVYKVDNSRGGELYLYHRASRRMLHFYLTDGRALMAQLANVFGEMYRFVHDNVGLPSGYSDENTEGVRHARLIAEGQKLIREYLEIAVMGLYKGVLSEDECEPLGQGVHYVEDPDVEGHQCLYFNNGNRVYRGRYDGHRVEWAELTGPTDGRYIFRLTNKPWSREVRSVQDLNEGNSIGLEDMKRARDDLAAIFYNHWNFTHQRIDSTYLANYILAMACAPAFRTKTVLSLVGEAQTGKSTALSVICGKERRDLQVLEFCDEAAEYSSASIYQNWDRSALLMVLDEFEADSNDRKKTETVAQISSMLRPVIGETGASALRGTAERVPYRYIVRTFVVTASISRATNPADESRRFVIETRKKEGLRDPGVAVFDTLSPARIAEIRRMLTIGMPKYIMDVAEKYNQVRCELNSTQVVPFNVDNRFIQNFYPTSAIMALFGEDWKPFVVQTCESRRDTLAAASRDTLTSNTMEMILRTPNVRVGSNGHASVLSLISKSDEHVMVNGSKSGVYWNENGKYLVIDWINVQAVNGLLEKSRAFDKRNYRDLKHQLDQHTLAIKPGDYASLGVYTFLNGVGVNVDERSKHLISVVNLADTVEPLRASQPPTPAVGSAEPKKSGSGNGSNGGNNTNNI